MAWYIKGALGGGYGGIEHAEWQQTDAANEDEAGRWAYEVACQEYESYGVFDYDAFNDENPDATEEDLAQEYDQDRESWIDYTAQWFDTNPNEEEE